MTRENDAVLLLFTRWLEDLGDDVVAKYDYRELSEWFGKEIGIYVKQCYEH